jgi:DNA repair protein RadA/Sms
LKPQVVIIDSIQVLYKPELASSPGSVSQVRECAASLTYLAKSTGISVFLIGHVTKEGTLAGPRVLEHIVDTILYFEGERQTIYRILRAVKNRFGSTNEIGVFQMTGFGLREVPNPSDIFLSERPMGVSGSIVVPTLEGSRPLLIEIQALVSDSNLGIPRRRTSGLDYNRVSLLIAVLEKRAGLRLQNQDIFINVAGGVKVLEPAADLGAAIAIASSFKENSTRDTDTALGEVGLSGEIRSVSQANIRCMEAQRLGFKRAILPKGNLTHLEFKGEMELVGVKTVNEALEVALSH